MEGHDQDNRIEGHFLSSSELVKLRPSEQGFRVYSDWQLLSEAVGVTIEAANRSLVLVDIDRTVIYPRGEFDNEYFQLRNRSLTEFVETFMRGEILPVERERITEAIDYVTDNCADYQTNELSVDFFKNEETVAALSMMLSVGVAKRDEINVTGGVRSTTSLALRRASDGGWISGLWHDEDARERCSGSLVWDEGLCLEQLSRLEVALRRNQAVFLPEYRMLEAALISELLSEGRIPWNQHVLRAISATANSNVMLLTDRPSMTLDAAELSSNNGRVRGRFADGLWDALHRLD